MKKILLTWALLLIFSPFVSFAQNANVGIIKGIWFSNTQFFDGDTIRVYTALQNNSGSDVEGTIEFFDNDVSLGEKEFSALDGRIIESWIDTLAISGEHEFSVKINHLQKNDVDSGVESVTAQSIFSERLAVVKIDTDGDRISDDIDTDDDGDGYTDTEEQELGTNPLDKNDTPKDKENSNSENVLSTIGDMISNLFSNDNEKIENNESETEDINTELGTEEISENKSPEFIQKLEEQSNFVKSINSQITVVQDVGQRFIQKEQSRIKKSAYPKTEKVSTDINEGASDNIQKNEKSSFGNFLTTLYTWILNIFNWLFSLWWFVVILLFFGIYILLRLLFKIFGRKN